MHSDSPTYIKGALFGFAAVSIWAGWSVMTRLAGTTGVDDWDILGLVGLSKHRRPSGTSANNSVNVGTSANSTHAARGR